MVKKRRWITGLIILVSIFYIKVDYLHMKTTLEIDSNCFPDYCIMQFIPYRGYGWNRTGDNVWNQIGIDLLSYHVPFLKCADVCDEQEDVAVTSEQIVAWNETQVWEEQFMDAMEEENRIVRTQSASIDDNTDDTGAKQNETEQIIKEKDIPDRNQLFSLLKQEQMQRTYIRENLKDIELLKKNFYTIDPTTDVREGQLDIDKFMSMDMQIEKDDEPQILIYHTHSQEAFADSIPGDASTSIVGAGEFLAHILSEQYGYKVIHHCGEYDVESRDYAYAKAAPALDSLLKQYPSIDVVIDLHRDAVADETRLVSNIEGIDVAQFMFFDGLSYTKERGAIPYLENPYIENNLALSFQMKLAADSYYPNLARKIYLKGYRYNMQYCSKSLLIELGAQTNTVQEIMNACIPLAHTIDIVLSGKTPMLIE